MLIEQELKPTSTETAFATILTMVEVDPEDPAFQNPTKPIGPVYRREDANEISSERDGSAVMGT